MPDASTFEQDISDVHLIYDYDAINEETKQHEKWRYEMWFYSKACTLMPNTCKSSLIVTSRIA